MKFRTGSANGLRRAEHLVLFHPWEHQKGQGHTSQASVPETGSFSAFLLMGYEDLCQQILHYAGSLLRLREEQQIKQPTNVILMAGEAAVPLCLCVLPMLIRKPPSHCHEGWWITHDRFLPPSPGSSPGSLEGHECPESRWFAPAPNSLAPCCCGYG